MFRVTCTGVWCLGGQFLLVLFTCFMLCEVFVAAKANVDCLSAYLAVTCSIGILLVEFNPAISYSAQCCSDLVSTHGWNGRYCILLLNSLRHCICFLAHRTEDVKSTRRACTVGASCHSGSMMTRHKAQYIQKLPHIHNNNSNTVAE